MLNRRETSLDLLCRKCDMTEDPSPAKSLHTSTVSYAFLSRVRLRSHPQQDGHGLSQVRSMILLTCPVPLS